MGRLRTILGPTTTKRESRSVGGAGYDRFMRSATPGSLLVFDGDCSFCTTSVETLGRMLPRLPEAVPYQRLDLDDHGLTPHDVAQFAWVLTPSHQYAGHLALSALLRMQPSFGLRFLGQV